MPRFKSRDEYERWKNQKNGGDVPPVDARETTFTRGQWRSRLRPLILPTLTGLVLFGVLLSVIVSKVLECNRELQSMRTLIGVSRSIGAGFEPPTRVPAIILHLQTVRRNIADLSVSECLRSAQDALAAAVDGTSQGVKASSDLARSLANGETDLLQLHQSMAKIRQLSAETAHEKTFAQCETAACPWWLNVFRR